MMNNPQSRKASSNSVQKMRKQSSNDSASKNRKYSQNVNAYARSVNSRPSDFDQMWKIENEGGDIKKN